MFLYFRPGWLIHYTTVCPDFVSVYQRHAPGADPSHYPYLEDSNPSHGFCRHWWRRDDRWMWTCDSWIGPQSLLHPASRRFLWHSRQEPKELSKRTLDKNLMNFQKELSTRTSWTFETVALQKWTKWKNFSVFQVNVLCIFDVLPLVPAMSSRQIRQSHWPVKKKGNLRLKKFPFGSMECFVFTIILESIFRSKTFSLTTSSCMYGALYCFIPSDLIRSFKYCSGSCSKTAHAPVSRSKERKAFLAV